MPHPSRRFAQDRLALGESFFPHVHGRKCCCLMDTTHQIPLPTNLYSYTIDEIQVPIGRHVHEVDTFICRR